MMNEFKNGLSIRCIWIKVSFHKEINLFAIQNGIKISWYMPQDQIYAQNGDKLKDLRDFIWKLLWFAFRIIRDLWMIIERFVFHSCWNCTNLKWSMSSKCNASKSSIAYFTHMTNIIVQKRVPNSMKYGIWNILLEFLRNKTES